MEWIMGEWFIRCVTEVVILWIIFYQIYRIFRGSRGGRILMGLTVFALLIALVGMLTVWLDFWVLNKLVQGLIIGLFFLFVVVFQQELRSYLARVSNKLVTIPVVGSLLEYIVPTSQEDFLETFCDAVSQLSNKNIGALFAFERADSLSTYVESGIMTDARFSPELVLTSFHMKTPLHDGGMIIVGERIEAARCIFPVSQREMPDRSLGMRHRAGAGITENTDCVVVVVSEETGGVTLIVDGVLESNMTIPALSRRLHELLEKNDEPNS